MTQSSQKRERQFTSTTESSLGGPTQSTPIVFSSDAELLTWVIQETNHSAVRSSLLSSIPTASPSDLEVLKRLLEPLVASALNPLHCVRCHQPYVERENRDWSCTIPHLEADYDMDASDDYFSYGHPRER
ncbi:hypothetical protein RhiJN_27336 [Ceratobasidium sp. AG-Ba]|nr:hypothetical protein RhiJN_27336 [Ceratobasidium sp. AG-Ba]